MRLKQSNDLKNRFTQIEQSQDFMVVPDFSGLIAKSMKGERQRFKQELQQIERMIGSGGKNESISIAASGLLARIERLKRKVLISVQQRRQRIKALPTIQYNEELPIFAKKDEIIEAIRHHRVIVVSGETGSGKTTQLPKFCLEAGRGIDGCIGCTQPRRIAAVTVSRRIAEELGEPLGKTVGYKIRFSDKTSPDTFIKIMTDGILLAEAQGDRLLNFYDTIIVDEAHERSLNIDFVLGIIKKLMARRRDLKLIITSATIDKEKFSRAFFDAPVIEVSGRMFPVEVRYYVNDLENRFTPNSEEKADIFAGSGSEEETHIEMAVEAVWKLHRETRLNGGILVFMPTEQDIRDTCEILSGRLENDKSGKRHATVFPLYARMPAVEQSGIFGACKGRMIIVATNIAETSLTIPGIQYVVDTGLARISQYSPRTRTTSLPVSPISISSADQRKGRCGRVRNGICIRLYSQADYLSRPQYTLPEILRSNLAEVILRMIALNLGDINQFPFVDSPSPKQIKDGFDVLTELDAITYKQSKSGKGSRPVLTDKGRIMAGMPLDPRLSRMLIQAIELGCAVEIAVIAAALSIQDPRERPADKADAADAAHAPFKHPDSDFLTLLRIWKSYHDLQQADYSRSKLKKFCQNRYLSYKRMREWCDIHYQICTILKDNGIELPNVNIEIPEGDKENSRYAAIHRSITCGFLSNIAMKKDKNIFTAAKNREAMIFPGSGLFNTAGSFIVAAEMIETSRLFARTVANIKVEWLESLGASQLRFSYSDPHWERNRGEVIAKEQVSLYGLIIVPGRPAPYGPVDPETASDIFIRAALVKGDLKRPFPFMNDNFQLVDEIRSLEEKVRRRDILIGEEEMFAFYKERLPGIYNIKQLIRILQEKGNSFFKMTREDLLRYEPGKELLDRYPDQISLGNMALPCNYRFNPGMPDDGVTVIIPADSASLVPTESLDWIAPGLLEEKITALIKGLPKAYRKQLVPVAKTVDIIIVELFQANPGNWWKGSLIEQLGNFILRRFGVDIPTAAWPLRNLPEHLNLRIAVTGPNGEILCSGRDRSVLAGNLQVPDISGELEQAQQQYERTNITDWDFGELPDSIQVFTDDGSEWLETRQKTCYLRLDQDSSGVCLKLFTDPGKAAKAHLKGVAALYSLKLAKDLKFLKKTLTLKGEAVNWSGKFGGKAKLESSMYNRIIQDYFGKDIRSPKMFRHHAEEVLPELLKIGASRAELVMKVIEGWSETYTLLDRLCLTYQTPSYMVNFLQQLNQELVRLVPENFPEIYPPDRMNHLLRYLKALSIRAERGVLNFDKEKLKAAELKPHTDSLHHLLQEMDGNTSERKRAAVEEYGWMIEEFKVSLFAQEQKTAFPISAKRLNAKLMEIERMV